MENLVDRVLRNKRESKYIEFKGGFDIASKQSWCEIIKDMVAMANSGGGAIAFGLDSKGNPTGNNVMPILEIDPAEITDKVSRYTSTQFDAFQLFEAEKRQAKIAILVIEAADVPFVFTKPGTYPISNSRQSTAFAQGTVYFRHGAKSEPAAPEDLASFISFRIDRARQEWMKRVRRVVQAPPGYQVRVLPQFVKESDERDATPIRIVNDEDAPGYRKIDPDKTHPFRQIELIEEVNERLPEESQINAYDVLAVRRVYRANEQSQFFHQPKFGSPQYSMAFVEWIVDKFNEDPHFFENAREEYYKLRQDGT